MSFKPILFILTLFSAAALTQPAEVVKSDLIELQTRLTLAGYYHREIDGKDGLETRAAIQGYFGKDLGQALNVTQALNELRKSQNLSVEAERHINRQQIKSLTKEVQALNKIKDQRLENKQILSLINEVTPIIKDKLIADLLVYILAGGGILAAAIYASFSLARRGYKQTLIKLQTEHEQQLEQQKQTHQNELRDLNNTLLKEADTHITTRTFRTQGRTLDTTAYLFWNMIEHYNSEENKTLYVKLLKVQLMSAKLLERTVLKVVSVDSIDVKDKLLMLSNTAYYYVDQDIYKDYYRSARELLPHLEKLIGQIKEEDRKDTFGRYESTIYVGYKLKEYNDEKTKEKLESLVKEWGASQEWFESIQPKYNRIQFSNPN